MAKLRVELALSGKGHCAWCDTLIAKGSPRVARRFYHAEGDYSRNNGAATGHNPGGLQDEYMHAQCAGDSRGANKNLNAIEITIICSIAGCMSGCV